MRWAGAVALIALAGCARRTDFIGRVQVDGGGGGDGSGFPADGAASGSDGGLAGVTCPSVDPALPPVLEPVWTCGVHRCLRDPMVDPSILGSAAADPDPAHRPKIEYPLPGSVHPPNLARIAIQWRRRLATQTTFRIRIDPGAGQVPYDLHVPYQTPVGATDINNEQLDGSQEIPDSLWRYIAQRHAGAQVWLTVAARDAVSGLVATSDAITIKFSPTAIEAGLFYLATEGATAGIQRHVFGTQIVQQLVQPGTQANAFNCGGCHSVSRDGTLAFAATYAGNLTVASTRDLDHPTMRPPPPPAADVANGVAPAVSPDGTYIVARHGVSDSLVVYNANGAPVGGRTTVETVGRIDFPEFSPDGGEIVATRAKGPDYPPKKYSAYDGQVVVLPFVGGAIGPPEVIVEERDRVYTHPSWSPDGQWIVFASSPVGQESHRNRQTRLRLVNRKDRRTIDLGNATVEGEGSNFPKFAPLGQANCRLFFIAFHSRRDYGVLRRNSVAAEGGRPQLWLTAIDLNRIGDPSTPPIWFPYQDINQQNLLPVWSADIPCAVAAECGPDAICQAGRCRARL